MSLVLDSTRIITDTALGQQIGPAIKLSPDGMIFGSPVTITVKLPLKLQDPATTQLSLYDPSLRLLFWQPSEVDHANSIVTTASDHFSTLVAWKRDVTPLPPNHNYTYAVVGCPSNSGGLTAACIQQVEEDVKRGIGLWAPLLKKSGITIAPGSGSFLNSRHINIRFETSLRNDVIGSVFSLFSRQCKFRWTAVAAWNLVNGNREIILNDDIQWFPTETGTIADANGHNNVERAVAHELGHHIGLSHINVACDPYTQNLLTGGADPVMGYKHLGLPLPLTCDDLFYLKQILPKSTGPCANTLAKHQWPIDVTVPPNSPISPLPEVLVTDGANQPIEGVTVVFDVTPGGGTTQGRVATTDTSGIARVPGWTAGSTGQQTLTAYVHGTSPDTLSFDVVLAAAPPDQYVGVWRGSGTQVNPAASWTVLLTYTGGAVGTVVGSIAYPSLQCGGQLTLTSVNPGSLVLRERITYGPCIDNGDLTLRLTSGTSLAFDWRSQTFPTTGSASLTRVNGPAMDVPVAFSGIWVGQGFQYNPATQWSILLGFANGSIGTIVGSIAYPSVRCGGELHLRAASGNRIELLEDITYGNCVDQGIIATTLVANGAMNFEYRETATGPIAAVGSLIRAGGQLPSTPAPPSSLSATAASSTQVNLAWMDNSSEESGFVMERAAGAGPFAAIAILGPNVANYQDTGLSAGTPYSYRVRSFNAGGNSAYSNVASTAGSIVFAQVTAGGGHTCGLTSSGVAYCWGDNTVGQLGDGTNVYKLVPTLVTGGFTFVQLTAGGGHTCGRTSTGVGYCWGANNAGQFGDGTQTGKRVPTPVAGVLSFVELTAGNGHTCGRTSTGVGYCWGANNAGQLGDGTTTPRVVPTPVSGGVSFAEITAGGNHTCGRTNTGVGYCWGRNGSGRLGDGTQTDRQVPTPVAGGLGFVEIASGGFHTCGLTSSGVALCWGDNTAGQVGDGTQLTSRFAPTAVAGEFTFVQLTAGNGHSCGHTSTGAAYCWGHSAIGDGVGATRLVPTAVVGGFTFVQLTAGNGHSCGHTSTGDAYCWGSNMWGQLGDGTQTDRLVPTPVRSP